MDTTKLLIKHCFGDIISPGPGSSITRSSSSSALVNSPAVLASSSSSGSSDGGEIINDQQHQYRLPSAISALAISGSFLYAASGPNVHVFEYDSNNSSSQTPLLHHYLSFPTSAGAAPVKSICFSGEAFVLTAHQDGKIRVWQRQLLQSTNYTDTNTNTNTNTKLKETASSQSQSQSQSQQRQKKQIIRYRSVALLPTTTDRLRRFAIPNNYVQVRRHKKRLWIHHHDAVSALVLAPPPPNNYHHRLSSTITTSTASNNTTNGGGAGLLYSVSWDKSLKVWRASDFKCLESVTTAHDDAVNAVAVSPDGSFVYTGSADGRIRVWAPVVARAGKRCSRISSNMRHELVATLDKHRSPINALALMMMMTTMNCFGSSSEMLLFSGACDGSILAWERENKDEDITAPARSNVMMRVAGLLRGHDKAVLCLIVAGDVLVSGSADRTVRMWRRKRCPLDIGDDDQFFCCLRVMEGHRGPVKSLAVATSLSTTSTTTTPIEDCNYKGGEVGVAVISVFSGSLDGEIRLWHFDLSSSLSGGGGGGGRGGGVIV